jgi:hypothetical protein
MHVRFPRRTIPMKSFTAFAMPLAVLVPLVAGCGSAGPSGTTGQSGSGQQPGQSAASAAYAYSRCMRSHGVPKFPDPHVVSSPGHVAVSIAVNPSETSSPSFNAAQKACSGILGPLGGGPTPAQQRAKARELLALAQCMRAKGVQDFPDPDRQGRLKLQMLTAAGVDYHSREFLAAGRACAGVTHGLVTIADVEALVHGTH